MKRVLLGIVLIVFSCSGQKQNSRNNSEIDTASNDRLTLIVHDNYSGVAEAQNLIIRDQKVLKGFYSKINRTRKPGLPMPTINFEKEMVLVHCSGLTRVKEDPVLSIVEETDNELIVKISEVKKGQKPMSSAEISPFIVYKMPLSKKKITFKKVQ